METKQINVPVDGLNKICDRVDDVGIGADELINSEQEEIPTLLDPFLPTEGLGVVAGESDIGKSTWLRQLSMAIVSGEEQFLGFNINITRGRVVYVTSEDSKSALAKYCKTYSKHFAQPATSFKNLRFVQDSENILKVLDDNLKKYPADLVVMDVFTDFYLGKLNEATNVRGFLRDYFNLSHRYDSLILFCHHTGKAARHEQPNKHNLLGSQAIEAKSRITIELMADPSGNDNMRHMFITKGNYLAPDVKQDGYELLFKDQIFIPTERRTPKTRFGKAGDPGLLERNNMIKDMHNQGKTQTQIADVMCIDQSQVSRIIKGFQSNEAPF